VTSISSSLPAYGIANMLQQATATSSSSSTLSGVAGLLQGASGASTGMFGAISGTAATTNIIDPLTILGGNSSTGGSIQSILNQQKVTSQTNSIYTNVANRLTAMQNGQYQAQADWEKVADYAMQTGQPVAISLDSKGQVQALPQSQADLSKYSTAQQNQLYQAMNDISTMASKIQGNKKNDTMVADLNGAAADLSNVATGQLAAQSQWESQGQMLMAIHHPFTISLDSNGNLQVQDQVTSSMDNLPANQQTLLRSALETIPSMIANGTPSTSWQADAESYDQNAIPYYLSIDPITNQISAKEDSGQNITPSFMNTEPYPDIGDNTPLLKTVASYIQSDTPYFLDFDATGKIVAKQATAQNLIKYNTPATATAQPLTAGSILSLYA
jgi:hypothetical protein